MARCVVLSIYCSKLDLEQRGHIRMMIQFIVIMSCFIVAELWYSFIRKVLQKKRKPYEWQCFSLFFLLFFISCTLQYLVTPPYMLTLFLKFSMLYSIIGLTIAGCLFCVKYVHYQSYIYILNWLKYGEENHLL